MRIRIHAVFYLDEASNKNLAYCSLHCASQRNGSIDSTSHQLTYSSTSGLSHIRSYRGTASGSTCDMTDSKSAAALSDRLSCLKLTDQVVFILFCESIEPVISLDLLLINSAMSPWILRSSHKYSTMVIRVTFRPMRLLRGRHVSYLSRLYRYSSPTSSLEISGLPKRLAASSWLIPPGSGKLLLGPFITALRDHLVYVVQPLVLSRMCWRIPPDIPELFKSTSFSLANSSKSQKRSNSGGYIFFYFST